MKDSEVVSRMLEMWSTKNIEAILSYFTEDAIYINIPLDPPNYGKEEIRTFLNGFMSNVSDLEFITHDQVDDLNGTVMNERTDNINFHDKSISLAVVGVFKLKDGKIYSWKDYFDSAPLIDLGIDDQGY